MKNGRRKPSEQQVWCAGRHRKWQTMALHVAHGLAWLAQRGQPAGPAPKPNAEPLAWGAITSLYDVPSSLETCRKGPQPVQVERMTNDESRPAGQSGRAVGHAGALR